MTEVWRQGDGVISVSALALPMVALAVWVLAAWRRRRGVPARVAWWRSAAEVGAVAGTLPWVWMILTPRPAARGIQLTPLRDLAVQIAGEPGMAVAQIGGNLLVFAALGFFAPIRWAALASLPRLFALGAAGSVAVEIAQYALDLGRVSSVDDYPKSCSAAMFAMTSRPCEAPPTKTPDCSTRSGRCWPVRSRDVGGASAPIA